MLCWQKPAVQGFDWDKHVAILPRFRHVARDAWTSSYLWSDITFMHHAMKNDSPHQAPMFPQCNHPFDYRDDLYVSRADLEKELEGRTTRLPKQMGVGLDLHSCVAKRSNVIKHNFCVSRVTASTLQYL